jgi:uncharacterized SAM-binding protein YcdF (DUF218 family)
VFFFLSKTFDILFSPLTWTLALAAIGLAARNRRTLSLSAGVASFAILCGFSNEPVANALWSALESSAPATMSKDRHYDAVVVLSGIVDGTVDSPSYNESVDRLLTSFDLLRRDRVAMALLSGGSPAPNSAVEAPILAAQLERWGIAKDRLVTESESRNTHENALFSARIVRERGWKKVLLVTSAFHMSRALGCFRAEGVEADTLPVDYRAGSGDRSWLPRAYALQVSTAALREMAGRIIYRVRGYSR